MINPTTHAITEFRSRPPTAPARDRGRARRQPLVHRDGREQDRRDQPDHARHHRVRRPDRRPTARRASRPGPTATCGSPSRARARSAMINPTTHAITEFATPTAVQRPARDHGRARRQPLVHRVRRRTRSARSTRSRTRSATSRRRPPAALPQGITAGPDGNLWFTEGGASKIGLLGAGAQAASIAAPSRNRSGQQGTQQVCQGDRWSDWAGQQPSVSEYSFDGFQWLRDGSAITGATSQSYTPVAADVGHQLSCTVTVTYALLQTTRSGDEYTGHGDPTGLRPERRDRSHRPDRRDRRRSHRAPGWTGARLGRRARRAGRAGHVHDRDQDRQAQEAEPSGV